MVLIAAFLCMRFHRLVNVLVAIFYAHFVNQQSKNQSFVYKHDFSKDQNCRYILCYQCPVFVTCILTRHVVFTQCNKMHLKRKACFLLFQDFTHNLRNYQKSSSRIPKSVDVFSLAPL